MVNNILSLIICAIYCMLPAYFSNMSAMVFGGGKPLDLGKTLKDNNRIIGDGVSWKGLILGTLIGSIIGGIQGIISNDIGMGLLIGFTMGFGALVGDAGGSFIKRRMGIKKGNPSPLLDQLDFVIGTIILSYPILKPDSDLILTILIISPIIHLASNMIGYFIGIKDIWY